jgi:CheY-like chemotaxis protein
VLLLVEDEPLIRPVLEEELADAGFDLVVTADGTQGMAELEADASRFRGIVTDIRLGKGPGGWEIARRAREISPAMPVVYVSGDSAHEWTARAVPGSVMVAKPFVPAQSITALAPLLNQAAGIGSPED